MPTAEFTAAAAITAAEAMPAAAAWSMTLRLAVTESDICKLVSDRVTRMPYAVAVGVEYAYACLCDTSLPRVPRV
jgi:hypothetical protein